VVACPTDTLYGLAADPRSEEALAALTALKGRDAARAVALMASSIEQAGAIVELSGSARRLAELFWPGPLTIVAPSRVRLASRVTGAGGLVGIRVPAHAVPRALAQGCGHAITATSANVSGQPPTADPDLVAQTLPGLALLIDAGLVPGGPPSTLVEVVGDDVRLLREGAVPWGRVLESLERAP
jgi:L-threonylcarbamoyladenylate synthase